MRRLLGWMLCQFIGHDRYKLAGDRYVLQLCARCGEVERRARVGGAS